MIISCGMLRSEFESRRNSLRSASPDISRYFPGIFQGDPTGETGARCLLNQQSAETATPWNIRDVWTSVKVRFSFSVAGSIARDYGEHRTSAAHRDLQEKWRAGHDRISFAMHTPFARQGTLRDDRSPSEFGGSL